MGKIRILLALSVLVAHLGGVFHLLLVPASIAVELFFIISGFYMSLILSEKYDSYSLFISNRFLKIYPAYLFILAVTLVSSYVYFLITHNYENGITGKILDYKEKLSPGSMTWILLTNVTIFGQDALLFLKTDSHYHILFATNFQNSPIVLIRLLAVPQAWSISLELMFYLIAPFLVKLNTKTLILLAVLSLSLRLILYNNGLNFDPWTYRFFPLELLFFILGILSYKLYRSSFFVRVNTLKPMTFYICYGALLLILLLFQVFIKNNASLVILIAVFTCSLPFIFEKFKKDRIDKAIGDFSYELYICHQFCVYSLLTILKKVSLNTEISKILVIIFSVIFSYFVSLLVTGKVDKFRQKRVKLAIANAS